MRASCYSCGLLPLGLMGERKESQVTSETYLVVFFPVNIYLQLSEALFSYSKTTCLFGLMGPGHRQVTMANVLYQRSVSFLEKLQGKQEPNSMQLNIYLAPFGGVRMEMLEESIVIKLYSIPTMCQVFG